jgi:hypothetical protein
MERKHNLNNHPICQCRNSIKLRILEEININFDNKPCHIDKFVKIIFEKIKRENRLIVIDDSFLKAYIMSIIYELIDDKMIKHATINKEHLHKDFYFIKLDNRIGSKNLNSNKSELDSSFKNTKESLEKETHKPERLEFSFDQIKSKNKAKQVSPEEYKNELIEKLNSLKITVEKLKKDDKTKKLFNQIHKYNEIKDIGQELLGYMANNKQKRIKDLYEEFSISEDDDK